MALRETVVKETGHNGLQFREHDAAHLLLDGLTGLELGPSSHNAFGLEGSSSVAPPDDFDFYKDGQVYQNGKYIETDIPGEADSIPIASDSQDYILSSHVFEHVPNPFKAFIEWGRVIRSGGYVFMIVPQRDALESDRGRELSTFEEIMDAFANDYNPKTMPKERTMAAGGPRGHYWVYTKESLKEIIKLWSDSYAPKGVKWELYYEEDPDKKVGNGFCLVYKIMKPPVEKEEYTTTSGGEPTTPFLDITDANVLTVDAAKKVADKLVEKPARKRKPTAK